MAKSTDFLTPREFADDAGFVLRPISRDRDQAMGVLSDPSVFPSWTGTVPVAGVSYSELSLAQRNEVDGLAQEYADGRVQSYIDFGITELSQLTRRPMVDRLMAGDERLVAFPPNTPDGVFGLSISDFNRFADHGTDSFYAMEYHVVGDNSQWPRGHLDMSELSWRHDNVFSDRIVVFPSSGNWPVDMDTTRFVHFNYWVGVPVTDRKFNQFRMCVLIIAKRARGSEGNAEPFELTVKRILRM